MRIIVTLALIVLSIFINTPFSFAEETYNTVNQGVSRLPLVNSVPPGTNSFQDTDTRLVELKTVTCKYAKGKVMGEKVEINIFMDGYDLNLPIKKKFKTGDSWTINETYDFMDELVIRFMDDNIFRDKFIGDIRVMDSDINEDRVVEVKSPDVVLEVAYSVKPGQGYKAVIRNLRRIISNLNQRLVILIDENENLRSDNSDLENRIEDLEDEVKDLEYDLRYERSKND